MTGTERQFEHERYDELCALATAGELTPAESEMLFAHLNECADCSAVFQEYQRVATYGMDSLHQELALPKTVAAFDEEKALSRLLKATEAPQVRLHPASLPLRKPAGTWSTSAWLRGAIAASVLLATGAGSYWIGARSKSTSQTTAATAAPSTRVLVAGTSGAPDAAPGEWVLDKRTLESQIQSDNQRISAFEEQANRAQSELEKQRTEAENASDKLAAVTADFLASKNQAQAQIAALTQERDASAARLHDAEAKYQAVQDELNSLRSQHQRDLLQMAWLEERVDTLSASLKDSNTRATNDEAYLSSDKDIRDLIGARSLYIADILDVDESGQSRKPFGRVFYTKTKSLIFYAYDLDRQPGVRTTSTFQVWGRTGSGDRQPINLGVLYMDSETNKRWTLRVDNPQQLAQLEAVFVTIEPHPQSERPTGKPFLIASLRREPNHP